MQIDPALKNGNRSARSVIASRTAEAISQLAKWHLENHVDRGDALKDCFVGTKRLLAMTPERLRKMFSLRLDERMV